jgi:hypothetical protein
MKISALQETNTELFLSLNSGCENERMWHQTSCPFLTAVAPHGIKYQIDRFMHSVVYGCLVKKQWWSLIAL